jgi:crotonobetainyl-CoA:carnitine CoA-transferase CaiB-like acyl-CoA transferase
MKGPLAGVRVLDLTDERAIYGAKLLADLGADVVRPEAPAGDPLRHRGPFADGSGESLWYAYFATSRRGLRLDLDDPAARAVLQRLAERADIVMTCSGAFGVAALDLEAVRARHPAGVHVAVTPFGVEGPWRDWLAPDLVAGALGGVIGTTGTPDTPPLKTFGELNFITSGVYAAIAGLSALQHASASGTGQQVGVSVHECLVSALEHVLMLSWYGETMGRGRVLPRQGGTHWSMALTVMPGRGGAILATPLPDFDAQLAWLVEADAHQDLLDERYQGPANLPLYIGRMIEVMRDWVATQDVEALFYEGQARHSPYGWVLPVERLADNPQLAARDWWTDYRVGDATVRGPGAPYVFSDTAWRCGDAETVVLDAAGTQTVLGELGWEQRP